MNPAKVDILLNKETKLNLEALEIRFASNTASSDKTKAGKSFLI